MSLNARALAIVEEMVRDRDRLRLAVAEVAGARVIDCGVTVPGGWEAGCLFAACCLAGLGRVTIGRSRLGEREWPAVEVVTDHPALACLGSQYAGWFIKGEGFSGMGSGPARALARVEELFGRLRYQDRADCGVLALESRKLPGPDVVGYVAGKCGIAPHQLHLLVAPTASLVGSIQIAARAVETGLHKMMAVGFDPGVVVSGWGCCVVPPVAADDGEALGRTNDAVLYGSVVHYAVRESDDTLQRLVEQLPSQASRDWGQPFGELFRRYGDFYSIDPHLFSPAEVYLTSLVSGRTFHAGRQRPDILERSFGIVGTPGG